MSFYEILGVEKSCSADDIEWAAKSCVKQLHDDVHGEMKQKTIDYIKSIASILLSEEGRECYDNIMSTKQSYTSPLRASLILKRVAWYNNISTVQFGESFLQHLQSTSRELRAPPLRWHREAGAGPLSRSGSSYSYTEFVCPLPLSDDASLGMSGPWSDSDSASEVELE